MPFIIFYGGVVFLTTEQLNVEVEALSKLIEVIDSNVKFNINIMWIVITITVTLASGTLIILAKSWFEKLVEKRLQNFEGKIIKQVHDEIKDQYQGMTIELGQQGLISVPFERQRFGESPTVFVRPHEYRRKPEVKIDTSNITIKNIENTPLKIDILIIKESTDFTRL